jgi:hypothetical protein
VLDVYNLVLISISSTGLSDWTIILDGSAKSLSIGREDIRQERGWDNIGYSKLNTINWEFHCLPSSTAWNRQQVFPPVLAQQCKMRPKPGEGPILIKMRPTVTLTSEHSGQIEKKLGRKGRKCIMSSENVDLPRRRAAGA